MEVEELTKKLLTMKPPSPPRQLRRDSSAGLHENDEREESPIDQILPSNQPSILARPETGAPGNETESQDEPPVPIPLLSRQITSPNDDSDPSEQPQNLVLKEDEEMSEDSSRDIFSGSPAIDPASEEDEEEEDHVSNPDTQNAPTSPIPRSRRVSEDRLLNSLQKKLSMVRQTSVEVAETYDRLSSPTKKSQNRPNPFFLLNDEGAINLEEHGEHYTGVDADETDPTDATMTPYRPVALFQDLAEEARSNNRLEGATQELSSPSVVMSTPTHHQSSPVVVLYADSAIKSVLPSANLSQGITPHEEETSTILPPQPKDGTGNHTSRPTSYESDLSQYTLKEGFLMKRGFLNKAFQRRWCVLKGKEICYYKQYRDKDVRGKINCCNATVTKANSNEEELPFAFYIDTPKDR
jgi:hypothetical protein